MDKICEICSISIPPEFVNNLCGDCYNKLEKSKSKQPEIEAEIADKVEML